jgi:hypothetical protein
MCSASEGDRLTCLPIGGMSGFLIWSSLAVHSLSPFLRIISCKMGVTKMIKNSESYNMCEWDFPVPNFSQEILAFTHGDFPINIFLTG